MSEQTVNRKRHLFTSAQIFKHFIVVLSVCLLSACMPAGEQDVNTELFKDKEDMKVRSAQLKSGMSKKATFEALGVAPEKFERMNTQDMQFTIYGNSQVQGSPEQLEAFKQRMLAYEGYALPYREIKSSNSLGFGKMKVHKSGYDLRLVLIFERDRLVKSTVEGTQDVKQQEDKYLWNSLIMKGLGAAF